MMQKVRSNNWEMGGLVLGLAMFGNLACAAEVNYSDLPPILQVTTALKSNANVITAETGIKLEHANQDRLENGSHEFNLRLGSARRHIVNANNTLREWDVALERPIRLPNKMMLDYDIGAEGVSHAEYALGDTRHEAERLLLHLWFNWQREQAQAKQWQQQLDILQQQEKATEQRLQAGDAPRMELGQARAAAAQARVSLQLAKTRSELAANELLRQFPGLVLPEALQPATPQPIEGDLESWKKLMLEHNHELGMARSEARIQQLAARRSNADRLPDPTIGLRVSNEMGGNERVTGLYFSVPLSFGVRGSIAEGAGYQAEIAANREAAVERRLDRDIAGAYAQAIGSHTAWIAAHEAADSQRQQADLVSRAYKLGESSLSDTLSARRLALESSLSEAIAQLDANEARYRLLLDVHQLWALDEDGGAH